MNVTPLFGNISTQRIRNTVLDEQGFIRVLPASVWLSFPWEEVRLFMHEYPIYVLPTAELIASLRALIASYGKIIEIGAGTGNIGRNLGIRMTDSYLQERPEIKAYYSALGQPTISYPKDVLRCDALTALRTLKPDCVIGCYVTNYSESGEGSSWGVDFMKLLPRVKRLILVCNEETHGANPIMRIFHKEYLMPGRLITRAGSGPDNRIYVWGEISNLL